MPRRGLERNPHFVHELACAHIHPDKDLLFRGNRSHEPLILTRTQQFHFPSSEQRSHGRGFNALLRHRHGAGGRRPTERKTDPEFLVGSPGGIKPDSETGHHDLPLHPSIAGRKAEIQIALVVAHCNSHATFVHIHGDTVPIMLISIHNNFPVAVIARQLNAASTALNHEQRATDDGHAHQDNPSAHTSLILRHKTITR